MEGIAKRIEPCPEEIIGKEDIPTFMGPKGFLDDIKGWVKGKLLWS